MMFKCDKCGVCCKKLDNSEIYKDFHNGDGVCKYLNGNLCSIYDKRPLICRVDESYEVFFADSMSYEEYLKLNYECCRVLKRNLKEE